MKSSTATIFPDLNLAGLDEILHGDDLPRHRPFPPDVPPLTGGRRPRRPASPPDPPPPLRRQTSNHPATSKPENR